MITLWSDARLCHCEVINNVLEGRVVCLFLSGGAASTTVQLHTKYETKQELSPRRVEYFANRRPSSVAQNADFGAWAAEYDKAGHVFCDWTERVRRPTVTSCLDRV